MNVGYLSISAAWSRMGDGDLVVRTPSGKVISQNNKGPSASTDQGALDQDSTNRGPENIFWDPTNAVTPPSGTYYVCFETTSFTYIAAWFTLTVTIRITFSSGATIVLSKQITATQKNSFNCNSSANTLIGSFNYP